MAGAVTGPPKLGASDVTVLMPLTSLDAMRPRDGLLPDAIGAQVGQLVEHYTGDDTLARLRVVCARFDSCAPKPGGDANACIGEVRVVLQPLLVTDGVLGAQDAAVHVFYDLDAATKHDLTARIAALPGANAGEPLAVSARMANPDYATAVESLITDFTTRGALSRVTFLRNTDVKGNAWMFGGFDINAGVAAPLVVPRVSGSQQGVVINGDINGPFTSSLSPAPTGADTLGMLLDATRLDILASANPNSAEQAITTGEAAANALEDPAKHDSTTADCASCHLAESARIFGHQFAAAHGLEPAVPPQTFTAAQTLRACGYVGTTPMISQRTQNESALAAARMGALLP